MGVGSKRKSRFSREDEAKNLSMSQLVSTLRTEFGSMDFNQVEQALVAREATLKQEIEKQKNEYAMLDEKHHFELLEKFEAENKLKECEAELVGVKELLKAAHERYGKLPESKIKLEIEKSKNEYVVLAEKHQFEQLEKLEVVNQLKECKDELVMMKEALKAANERYEKLLEEALVLREAKVKQEIEKQKNEFVVLHEKHQFERLEKLEVQNQLQECKAELVAVKEALEAANERYKKLLEEALGVREAKIKQETEIQTGEFVVLHEKHQFEQREKLQVENELKECKAELVELKQALKAANERYEKLSEEALVLREAKIRQEIEKQKNEFVVPHEKYQSERLEKLEVENQLKECKAELVAVEEARKAANEKYEKLLEEALVAREEKLNEIEKQKNEYAVLKEKHQNERLEKLGVEKELKECMAELVTVKDGGKVAIERYEKLLEEVKKGRQDNDKEVILELQRKNSELESKNMKLEALLVGKIAQGESCILQLKDVGMKLLRYIEGGSENGETVDVSRNNNNRRVSSAHAINLENVFDSSGNGCMAESAGSPPNDHSPAKGNGDLQTSGFQKLSSGDVVLIIDSDDDCAPRDIETMCEKEISEKHKDNDSLGLTGVEKNPRVLKRKRASSLNISDNENDGDDLEQDIIPTGEMKQQLKLSLEPSGCLVNHCSEVVVSSAINDCEKQNNPSSWDRLILRQSEGKIGEKQKLQNFFESLAEVSDSDVSSSSSSSSSDSEDDYQLQSLLNIAMPKAKAREGNCFD